MYTMRCSGKWEKARCIAGSSSPISDGSWNDRSASHGFSVTIPHKQQVMRYLDRIDPTARKIGAVNTVVRRNGENSMARTPMPRGRSMPSKGTCVVQGQDHADRRRRRGCQGDRVRSEKEGSKVRITNRTAAKSRRLARELGALACAVRGRRGLGHPRQCDVSRHDTACFRVPRAAELHSCQACLRRGL